MESDTDIKECWGDLIEYIMIRFVRAAKKSPSTCIRTMFGSVRPRKGLDSSGSTSSGSERDSLLLLPSNGLHMGKIRSDRDRLYWLYLQFEQAEDPIGLIVDALFDEFNVHIDKKEIMTQLIAKGIIRDSEMQRFELLFKDEVLEETNPDPVLNQTRDEIGTIVEELCKTNMKQQVIWIHDFLLKVVAVRSADEAEERVTAVHAVPFYSEGKNFKRFIIASISLTSAAVFSQAIPLVPFNENQEMALNCAIFLNLLQELHISLPQSSVKLYPRVPLTLETKTIFDLCVKIAHYAGHEPHYSC